MQKRQALIPFPRTGKRASNQPLRVKYPTLERRNLDTYEDQTTRSADPLGLNTKK